eukprot:g21779.t1
MISEKVRRLCIQCTKTLDMPSSHLGVQRACNVKGNDMLRAHFRLGNDELNFGKRARLQCRLHQRMNVSFKSQSLRVLLLFARLDLLAPLTCEMKTKQTIHLALGAKLRVRNPHQVDLCSWNLVSFLNSPPNVVSVDSKYI